MWNDEFPDDYDVPAVLTNDPDLTDISWHNDIAPSFCLTADEEGTGRRLWSDHPVPAEREGGPDAPRYMVTAPDDEDGSSFGSIYEGDDLNEALRILKAANTVPDGDK